MKDWPEKEDVSMEDLIQPVKEALNRLLNDKPAGYDGYPTPSCNHVSLPPDQTFEAESLEYHQERGRDEVDIALMVAFQLGYEQAKRFSTKDNELIELLKKIGGER